MVAIIGSRGSGKTALADLIAAGAFGVSERLSPRSFIRRAWDYLGNTEARLKWSSGHQTSVDIHHLDEKLEAPEVQYLTQQFVDDLCSAEGATDELLSEVERVIFNAHSGGDRAGMESFRELLEVRAYGAREKRNQSQVNLQQLSELIAIERNKKNSIEGLTKTITEKTKAIEADKTARASLVRTGQEERQNALGMVNAAVGRKTMALDRANRRVLGLRNLSSSIASARATSFPNYISTLKQKHLEAGLTDEQWNTFSIDFTSDVDMLVETALADAQQQVVTLTGTTPISATIGSQTPLLSQTTNYSIASPLMSLRMNKNDWKSSSELIHRIHRSSHN